MVLINGKPGATLDVADRGFQYGDGLFETLSVKEGRLRLLEQHLERLQRGCERLLLPCPSLGLLADEAAQIVRQQSQAVLKIIITRGVGGRGYRQPDAISVTRILSLHPYPDYPAHYWQQGIAVRFCQTPLGLNPALAGIKHLNRLEQVLARAEWRAPDIQEGLMLDGLGRVIEGTMSNLFFIKDQILFTSPLDSSGIAGVMRAHVIQLAKAKGIQVIEQYFMRETLLAADELFVTNSVIGLWPIRQLEQKTFVVGGITQKIINWLAQSS